jgi:hypothetical protein
MSQSGGGGGAVTIVFNGDVYGTDAMDELADRMVRRLRSQAAWS